MTNSHELPIFRSALELAVYMETIVKGFDKYHKYTIGEEMRRFSKEMLFIINRVGLANDRHGALIELRDRCEDMKMLLLISKELQAFKSFKQFEHSSKLTIDIAKQAAGWLKSTARVSKS
ncbi:MAG: four helix bundle protein [Campylobacterales bacterium]|nr:four helix bundle protein [Campylobacterales bacterium]